MRGGGRRVRRRSCSWLFARRAGARPHGTARGDRPRRRPVSWSFVWLCASLALIAMVDVPLQLFQFKRSLRMTRQELRDEAKESDGRPETKQRIRQMQQTIGAAPHDAQGADGGRGDRQPDALRRGAQVRSEEHARAARGGEGRRSGRAEHPPHRRGASRAGIRVAETGARAVSIDRLEQAKSPPACTWRSPRCFPTSSGSAP